MRRNQHTTTDQLFTMSGLVRDNVKRIAIDANDMRELNEDGGDARANRIGTSQFEVASSRDKTARLHWTAGKTRVVDHTDDRIIVQGLLAEVILKGSSIVVQPGDSINQTVDVCVTSNGTIDEVTPNGQLQLFAATTVAR